jgi:hypothetical protein
MLGGTMLTSKEQAAVDAYAEYNNQRDAAESLGISRRSFRDHFDSAKAKMYNTPVGFKTTKIATDESGNVRAMQHKIAPEITNRKREGRVIKTSTLYGADGSVTGEWVMRSPEKETREDYQTALLKLAEDKLPRITSPFPIGAKTINGDLAMFPAIDEHLNVRLLADQVGQNYGLDSAVQLIADRFQRIVSRTPNCERALFVQLGDAMHQNDHMNVTPASKHVLQSDQSFSTASDAVVALHRYKLDLLLEKYEFVDVIGVAGNHDIDPAHWLFRCLQIAYEKEPRIDIRFQTDSVAAYEWGVNLLGFSHGHKIGKPDALAGVVSDRFAASHGRCSMRYLHTGHVHHDRETDTFGGYKWRSHRTIVPKDDYSYSNGYLSRQTMKSYVYSDYEGEVSNFLTNLV